MPEVDRPFSLRREVEHSLAEEFRRRDALSISGIEEHSPSPDIDGLIEERASDVRDLDPIDLWSLRLTLQRLQRVNRILSGSDPSSSAVAEQRETLSRKFGWSFSVDYGHGIPAMVERDVDLAEVYHRHIQKIAAKQNS